MKAARVAQLGPVQRRPDRRVLLRRSVRHRAPRQPPASGQAAVTSAIAARIGGPGVLAAALDRAFPIA